jgi:hypothetical protein
MIDKFWDKLDTVDNYATLAVILFGLLLCVVLYCYLVYHIGSSFLHGVDPFSVSIRYQPLPFVGSYR